MSDVASGLREITKLRQEVAKLKREIAKYPRKHISQSIELSYTKRKLSAVREKDLQNKQINLIKDGNSYYAVFRIDGVLKKVALEDI